MILTRILTTIAVLPPVLILVIGQWTHLWLAILTIFVGLSVWEFSAMLLGVWWPDEPAERRNLWRLWLTTSLMALFLGLCLLPRDVLESVAVITALWLCAGCFFIMPRSVPVRLYRWYLTCSAIFYCLLPWWYVWKLYNLEPIGYFTLLLIAVVMGSDTGGYLGGVYFGGKVFVRWPAIAPQISPNKTWEGAVGAMVVSTVISGVLVLWTGMISSPLVWLTIALAGSIASMCGDFLASAIKRFSGVKDSGRLLPGHGGFIDRGDGFVFTAPLIWWIAQVMGI